MSVEQLDVIDDVRVASENGPVVLTIVDSLGWSDSLAHQTALQQKFSLYLAFVESGELFKKFPVSQQSPVTIHIAFERELNEAGIRFVESATQALASAGIGLSYEVVPCSD
jgi:hypothetical protein